MAYTFDPIFAADPNNPSVVASNAAILIYNPADPGKAPVTITDSSGSPLSNPITVNKNGFGPAFQHATLDRLAWQGGGFEGYFTSYEGMKNAALAAQTAAENAAGTAGAAAAAAVADSLGTAVSDADAAATSANAAAAAAATSATEATNAAALVGAPADVAIAAAVNGTGATKTALTATILAQTAPKIDKVEADASFARSPVTDLFPTIAAMLKASTQASYIWTLGDSKSEGYGATTEANRYTRKLLSKLRAKYPSGAAGGIDFIPARFNLTEPAWTPQWTFTGSTANVGVGIAHRGVQLVYHATTPGTAALAFTGTGIDLLFWRLSTDTIEYRVDGGSWTSYVLPTGVKYAQRQITGLTSGAHTVDVRNSGASGSGPVLVGGVVYDADAAKGVHVVDCSISGGKMSGFVSVTGDSAGTIQNKQSWSEYLAYYPPKLLVISMGTNDVVTDTAAQYEANVRAGITLARSKVAGTPVLLIVPEEPSDRVLIEPWANYTAALKKISDDTTGVKFYDTARRFPKQGSGNPNGTYIDAVHYVDTFQDYWAQLVFEAITTDAT